MVRQNAEFTIDQGPSKLDLMLALFDTDLGERTVRFQIGSICKIDPARKTNWLEVRIISARRRHPSAKIWDITGITESRGRKERVSIYYLSDTREGRLRFEGVLLYDSILETPKADETTRANVLWLAIEKLITQYRNSHDGNLDEEMFRLFEKAKAVDRAEDLKSQNAAIENLKGSN